MRKKKTIFFSDYRELGVTGHQEKPFRVEQVTNSVFYVVGQYHTKKDVEQLCESSLYNVTIIEPKHRR